MGSARGSLTCFISSTTTQRPEKFYSHASIYRQYVRPENGVLRKKSIMTVRSIMIGQQIELVAGEFNETAWRCSNRDNLNSIDEASADCALPRSLGIPPLFGSGSIQNNWVGVSGFLELQIGIGRFECMVLSPSHAKPRRASNDQIWHHETWLYLEFVD